MENAEALAVNPRLPQPEQLAGVNNILIINHAVAADRITAILVHEVLGF